MIFFFYLVRTREKKHLSRLRKNPIVVAILFHSAVHRCKFCCKVVLEECKQECGGQKGRSGVWRRGARSQWECAAAARLWREAEKSRRDNADTERLSPASTCGYNTVCFPEVSETFPLLLMSLGSPSRRVKSRVYMNTGARNANANATRLVGAPRVDSNPHCVNSSVIFFWSVLLHPTWYSYLLYERNRADSILKRAGAERRFRSGALNARLHACMRLSEWSIWKRTFSAGSSTSFMLFLPSLSTKAASSHPLRAAQALIGRRTARTAPANSYLLSLRSARVWV